MRNINIKIQRKRMNHNYLQYERLIKRKKCYEKNEGTLFSK